MKHLKKKRRQKHSFSDTAFDICNYLILILILITTAYPILYVISASVSDPTAVSTGKMILLPVDPSLDGYRYILGYQEIWQGYLNTIIYTLFGTLFNLFLTIPAAYALSRRDLIGRNGIMILFLITMYFSGGLIACFLNIKSFGLLNTRLVLIINGGISTYNLIVARTFFANTIPWELHEAGVLDGCTNFRLFSDIVLPLSKPILAVMCLYYGINHWNSYFNAMLYLPDAKARKFFPLQLYLREILMQGKFTEAMIAEGLSDDGMIDILLKQAETVNMIKYGVIIVAMIPVIIVYPFLQRFFVKGVMIGSIKG